MPRFKRSNYLFFLAGESSHFDAGAFLRGELRMGTESHIEALSLLTGEKHTISSAQLDMLCRASSRSWSPASQLAGDTALSDTAPSDTAPSDTALNDVAPSASALGDSELDALAGKGWLLCDADIPAFAELRHREELLRSQQWHPYAALYHFTSREHGGGPVDLASLAKTSGDDAREFVKLHGPPPDPFHRSTNAGPPVDLPLIDKQGEFYETLDNRRTVRAFDHTRSLALQDLSVLLRYTFGCRGTLELSPETLLVHKTSPSGGSLHPIEAYPLILDVAGLTPGLYHYGLRDHILEPLQLFDRATASELAAELANGQLYAGSAHALILMTARFFRNQWKYRRRSRTYGVMLMDAGHLGQTFYLVATKLGLGAFFTAAINGPKIEETLGVEPQTEGALAICGCGVQKTEGADLGLAFKPYVPRKTVL